MNVASIGRQRGISLVGLIFTLAVLGVIGVLGLKIVPTVIEYQGIKKAIAACKEAGGSSVRDIQASFDKRANVAYIESIGGKDLDVVKNGNDFDISFSYQKKIPLFGPASLLLEYEGTTATDAPKKTIE